MGELVSLAVERARRDTRHRLDAARTAHPSLRWVVGDMWWAAHRRAPGGVACRTPGPLILAPPGVPLCPDCYPA